MENSNDRRRSTGPEQHDAPRDAGAAERIEQRREHDKEISRREDEGYRARDDHTGRRKERAR